MQSKKKLKGADGMSSNGLVKETLDLYNQDEYGDIVEIICEAINGAFDESIEAKEDVRGRVYFDAEEKDSGKVMHLATFNRNSGEENHYNYVIGVYYPHGYAIRKIIIDVNVKDMNSVGYGRITLEIGRRIATRINEAIASNPLHECAYEATLRWVILDLPVAFSQDSIYRIAAEIGIKDYGLVDKTLEALYKEGAISRDGGNGFRRIIKTSEENPA